MSRPKTRPCSILPTREMACGAATARSNAPRCAHPTLTRPGASWTCASEWLAGVSARFLAVVGEHNEKCFFPREFWRWFDPRNRSLSTWAFILNRITALGLTLYLFIHLIVLGTLAQGPGAYDHFIEFAHTPVIKIGEMLVIAAGLIHGLNGIRIALTSFGIGTNRQRMIFAGLMVWPWLGWSSSASKCLACRRQL